MLHWRTMPTLLGWYTPEGSAQCMNAPTLASSRPARAAFMHHGDKGHSTLKHYAALKGLNCYKDARWACLCYVGAPGTRTHVSVEMDKCHQRTRFGQHKGDSYSNSNLILCSSCPELIRNDIGSIRLQAGCICSGRWSRDL